MTAPEQLLLSQLVADIRAAAADAEIELEGTDRAAGKRTLVAALRLLVEWGSSSKPRAMWPLSRTMRAERP